MKGTPCTQDLWYEQTLRTLIIFPVTQPQTWDLRSGQRYCVLDIRQNPFWGTEWPEGERVYIFPLTSICVSNTWKVSLIYLLGYIFCPGSSRRDRLHLSAESDGWTSSPHVVFINYAYQTTQTSNFSLFGRRNQPYIYISDSYIRMEILLPSPSDWIFIYKPRLHIRPPDSHGSRLGRQ